MHFDDFAALVLSTSEPVLDTDWLREWREIPKMEVFAKDLPYHEDPHQRELGYVILRHIGEGSPFTFRYTGGSEPCCPHCCFPPITVHTGCATRIPRNCPLPAQYWKNNLLACHVSL